MKPWPGYREALYVKVPDRSRGIVIALVLAGLCFYFALETWFNEIDPCLKSYGHHCAIARFLSRLTGLTRYAVDVQSLGVLALIVAYAVWRKK